MTMGSVGHQLPRRRLALSRGPFVICGDSVQDDPATAVEQDKMPGISRGLRHQSRRTTGVIGQRWERGVSLRRVGHRLVDRPRRRGELAPYADSAAQRDLFIGVVGQREYDRYHSEYGTRNDQ